MAPQQIDGEARARSELFRGDDPTVRLHRDTDWAATPLGPVATWPSALRGAVRTVLPSQVPMILWWGPQLVQLYNQACVPLLGQKHPGGAGQSADVCWAEVWPEVEHMVAEAWQGRSTYAHELPLLMHRQGYDEETFWTFSYSPVFDEAGEVAGIFVATTDATASVVGARRLRVLSDLGSVAASDVRSVEAVLEHTCAVLAQHPGKVAFAVARLERDPDAGLEVVDRFGVDEVPDADLPGDAALLAQVIGAGVSHDEDAPDGGWPLPLSHAGAPVRCALHLPVIDRSNDRVVAVLTVGVNPHRALDDDYRSFLDLMARQVSMVVSDAVAFERAHERAAKLAELDRAKNRFLQNVSHELRTPLTLIAGSHWSLGRRTDLSEAARQEVEVAERGVQRLAKLVDGLLDLARADEGALAPALRPTDLARLTTEIASMFRSTLDRAGIELRVEVEATGAVLVDPEMWSQVVSNLVSNAYKFTERGTVEVRLQAGADELVLSVADTGIGMTPEVAQRAFDRFHQEPGASLRTAEGAGIGLSLVRDVAALHGGSASVDTAPGRGSTFTVRIPRRFGAGQVEAVEPLRRVYAVVGEAASWTGATVRDERGGAGPDRPMVLVVEDNADLRTYLAELLTEDGWHVVAVGDVPAALVEAVDPTLVLSDVMLPGADGIELVRRLREQPSTAEVPIVLLTARAGPEAAAAGLAAGATDYLPKPFDPEELLARVRSHASLHLRRTAALAAAGAKIEGLQVALETNRQIGAAIGIVMAARRVTQAQAFEVLRRASQDQNRKLRDIADEVVFTGLVPD